MPALKPLFAQAQSIDEQIKACDKLILKIAKEQYPETKALSQVNGVGTLTALTNVLTVLTSIAFCIPEI